MILDFGYLNEYEDTSIISNYRIHNHVFPVVYENYRRVVPFCFHWNQLISCIQLCNCESCSLYGNREKILLYNVHFYSSFVCLYSWIGGTHKEKRYE